MLAEQPADLFDREKMQNFTLEFDINAYANEGLKRLLSALRFARFDHGVGQEDQSKEIKIILADPIEESAEILAEHLRNVYLDTPSKDTSLPLLNQMFNLSYSYASVLNKNTSEQQCQKIELLLGGLDDRISLGISELYGMTVEMAFTLEELYNSLRKVNSKLGISVFLAMELFGSLSLSLSKNNKLFKPNKNKAYIKDLIDSLDAIIDKTGIYDQLFYKEWSKANFSEDCFKYLAIIFNYRALHQNLSPNLGQLLNKISNYETYQALQRHSVDWQTAPVESLKVVAKNLFPVSSNHYRLAVTIAVIGAVVASVAVAAMFAFPPFAALVAASVAIKAIAWGVAGACALISVYGSYRARQLNKIMKEEQAFQKQKEEEFKINVDNNRNEIQNLFSKSSASAISDAHNAASETSPSVNLSASATSENANAVQHSFPLAERVALIKKGRPSMDSAASFATSATFSPENGGSANSCALPFKQLSAITDNDCLGAVSLTQ